MRELIDRVDPWENDQLRCDGIWRRATTTPALQPGARPPEGGFAAHAHRMSAGPERNPVTRNAGCKTLILTHAESSQHPITWAKGRGAPGTIM